VYFVRKYCGDGEQLLKEYAPWPGHSSQYSTLSSLYGLVGEPSPLDPPPPPKPPKVSVHGRSVTIGPSAIKEANLFYAAPVPVQKISCGYGPAPQNFQSELNNIISVDMLY
jgi:hypothetical protein